MGLALSKGARIQISMLLGNLSQENKHLNGRIVEFGTLLDDPVALNYKQNFDTGDNRLAEMNKVLDGLKIFYNKMLELIADTKDSIEKANAADK